MAISFYTGISRTGGGGGGGGGTTDTTARALATAANTAATDAQSKIDAYIPDAGATVPAGVSVRVGNNEYENTSGADATTPTPLTEANIAADPNFTLVSASSQPEIVENGGALVGAVPAGAKWGVDTTTGGLYRNDGGNWAAVETGGAAKRAGPFTAPQTITPADFTDNVWRGSFNTPEGGSLDLTVPAGLPDGTEINVVNIGRGDLRILSGGAETFAGFANADPATANGQGELEFKKAGNYDLTKAIMALESSLSNSVIPPNGGEQFIAGVGRFANNTVTEITVPNSPAPTRASVEALGATYLHGMT